MSETTESIAIKILVALRTEYEREPSLLKCKLFNEILTEVGNKNRLTQNQVSAAVRQLRSHGHIKAIERSQDGKAALPSDEGLDFLANRDATNKAKTEFT